MTRTEADERASMNGTALLFPGQGSQYVGMGRWLDEFSEAADVLNRAESSGFDVRAVAFEGAGDRLNDTELTQPALLVVSIATLAILRARGIVYDAVAGHSLGEHSALVAAGVVSFETALQIVMARGELMAKAGKGRDAGMAAVLGLETDVLQAICEEATHGNEIVVIANYNCPGQLVISGDARALRRARDMATVAGAKRVVPLRVSGAFHSPLIESAERGMRHVIEEQEFATARARFYPNVTGRAESDVERIREFAVRQTTSPVMWEETIRNMAADGVTRFVEVGPGRVLSGLVRRILPGAQTWPTDTRAQLEEALNVLVDG